MILLLLLVLLDRVMGGNININATNSIKIVNSSNLNASNEGTENAGDISLNTEGTILFDGQGENEGITGIINNTTLLVDGGNAGDINLNANNILINNGATLTGSTFGSGDGGNIKS